MVFEEQFLCKLLNGMDCSEEKITEASNYMIKNIDNYRKFKLLHVHMMH